MFALLLNFLKKMRAARTGTILRLYPVVAELHLSHLSHLSQSLGPAVGWTSDWNYRARVAGRAASLHA
jgi:hypothetical protein